MIRPVSLRLWAGLSLCLLLGAAPAAAQSPASGMFALDTELFNGAQADYGMVAVEEDGAGGLHMTVSLDPAVVGAGASVRHVLVSMGMGTLPAGLTVVPDDPDGMEMIVRPQRRPWLTMGAQFGAVVSIKAHRDCRRHRHHHHHGHHSVEPVQEVGFTLMADEPLALDDVLGMAATRKGVVTQIGVVAFGAMDRRHPKAVLLGGLFEADPVVDDAGGDDGSDDGSNDGGDDGNDDGGGSTSEVPPGCIGIRDPATGELIGLDCE
jgi:hypothetical protein